MPMSASIGISLYPDHATDIDTLMQQADAAMYMAKQAGRSTHRLFSAEMNVLAEQRLALIAALRRAVAEAVLSLSYQPQIRSCDGAIHGVEALARWRDAVLGDVSPAKFIPLAEECGLIEQIGMWSVREACRQMASWRRAGLNIPCVSVNLSPINFRNVTLAARLKDILAEHDLPPDALMLEITEGAFMQDGAAALETMNAIRELGVGLSVDDFGTGYSSLSRLAHLPIRELKIDRSFMRDIEQDAGALAIATAGGPRRPGPRHERGRRGGRDRGAAQDAGRARLRHRPGLPLRAAPAAGRLRALADRALRRAGEGDAGAAGPCGGQGCREAVGVAAFER
ncbi:putative signal transduction protein with EAL and GGDEF domain [Bradyrhizobium yuanmingense]